MFSMRWLRRDLGSCLDASWDPSHTVVCVWVQVCAYLVRGSPTGHQSLTFAGLDPRLLMSGDDEGGERD